MFDFWQHLLLSCRNSSLDSLYFAKVMILLLLTTVAIVTTIMMIMLTTVAILTTMMKMTMMVMLWFKFGFGLEIFKPLFSTLFSTASHSLPQSGNKEKNQIGLKIFNSTENQLKPQQ